MDAYMHKYILKTVKQNTSHEQLMTVVIPTQLPTWSYDKKSSSSVICLINFKMAALDKAAIWAGINSILKLPCKAENEKCIRYILLKQTCDYTS